MPEAPDIAGKTPNVQGDYSTLWPSIC